MNCSLPTCWIGWGPISSILKFNELELTGQNLGRVFNSRCCHARNCRAVTLITKTAKL